MDKGGVRRVIEEQAVSFFAFAQAVLALPAPGDVAAERYYLVGIPGLDDGGVDFYRQYFSLGVCVVNGQVPGASVFKAVPYLALVALLVVPGGPVRDAAPQYLPEVAAAGEPQVFFVGVHHLAQGIQYQVAGVGVFHQGLVFGLGLDRHGYIAHYPYYAGDLPGAVPQRVGNVGRPAFLAGFFNEEVEIQRRGFSSAQYFFQPVRDACLFQERKNILRQPADNVSCLDAGKFFHERVEQEHAQVLPVDHYAFLGVVHDVLVEQGGRFELFLRPLRGGDVLEDALQDLPAVQCDL